MDESVSEGREPESKGPGVSLGALFTVLFVLGAGAIALGPAIFADVQAANIRSMGNMHKGTVVALRDTGDRFNQDPVVIVTLEVDLGERKVRGEVKDAISVVHLPRFQPGQVVQVWLDPADPTRMALEEGL